MQLTEETLNVLRNFSSIQSNLVVQSGSKIKTMAEARNVMSSAIIAQEFPQDFGIYDLNEFLNVLSLVDDPKLDFSPEYVRVTDSTGRSAVKYFFADPSILTSPSKDITMPDCEVSFTLDESTLSRVRKAASVLGHEKMTIEANDGSIRLTVIDNNDPTSSSFVIDVPGTYQSDKFCFVMNISNMKLISGDYEVGISSKLLSQFTNKNVDVVYYIALEKSSTYGE
jgi:hypothetical protein